MYMFNTHTQTQTYTDTQTHTHTHTHTLLNIYYIYMHIAHVYTIASGFMTPVQQPIHEKHSDGKKIDFGRRDAGARRAVSRLRVEKRAHDVYIISTLYTFTITTSTNSWTFCAVCIIKRYAVYCTQM